MKQCLIAALILTFITTSLSPFDQAHAQTALDLPAPGTLVALSPVFSPIQMKGVHVDDQDPLHLEFLVDKGDNKLYGQALKDEIARLAKYFLTCLTVPETDLWVNLSPYEKDRITAAGFGVTQMGKDLLEQDYLLKQITASISYPESALGKEFWQRVYKKAYEIYGTTHIPTSSFQKIWIVPKYAQVYVKGQSAFIVQSTLDVMTETDYLALKHQPGSQQAGQYSQAYARVFKEMLLPQLRKEVNEGKNFALVRQVYDAMILATWYKRHLKDGFLGQAYVGKNKVYGVDVGDKSIKEKIFERYLTSFKKSVYNYIREDLDPVTHQRVPRKYVSGGLNLIFTNSAQYAEDQSIKPVLGPDLAMGSIYLQPTNANGEKLVDYPDGRTFPNDHAFKRIRAVEGLDPAMRSHLRKLIPSLLAAAAFSVSALVMGPAAQAATFTPGENGSIIVNVEHGDDFGNILFKMQQAYYKADRKGFVASAFAGKLWGPQGVYEKISQGRDLNQLSPGDRIVITQAYSPQALQLLPKGKGPQAAVLPAPAPRLEAPPVPRPQVVDHGGDARGGARVEPSAQRMVTTTVMGAVAAGSADAFNVNTALVQADQMLAGQTSIPALEQEANVRGSATAQVTNQLTGIGAPTNNTDGLLTDAGRILDSYTASPMSSAGVQAPQAVTYPTLYVNPNDAQLLWGVGLVMAVLLAARGVRYVFRVKNFRKTQLADLLIRQSVSSAGGSGPVPPPEEVRRILQRIADTPIVNNHGGDAGEDTLMAAMERYRSASFRVRHREDAAMAGAGDGHKKKIWGRIGTGALNLMALGGSSFLSATMLGVDDYKYWIWALAAGMSMTGILPSVTGGLYCGIIDFMMRLPSGGISKKDLMPWLLLKKKALLALSVRGRQQAGMSWIAYGKKYIQYNKVSRLNKKRGLDWFKALPVFYRDMTADLFEEFISTFPRRYAVPDEDGVDYVIRILSHLRFATGGRLSEGAEHPHSSPRDDIEKVWWTDQVKGAISANKKVFIVIGHNGDNDGSLMGYSRELFGQELSVAQMRRYYAAVLHMRYAKKVSPRHLRRYVFGTENVDPNIKNIIRQLHVYGYLTPEGYVKDDFKGLDEGFKKVLGPMDNDDEKNDVEAVFNQIESALFDLPPGDSPVIPLQIRLNFTPGWRSVVRYVHSKFRTQDLTEAMNNIMLKVQEDALGDLFDQEYASLVNDFQDPNIPMEETIIRLKEKLIERMTVEAFEHSTVAGRLLRLWEQQWEGRGLLVPQMRALFVTKAVEKFFTNSFVNAVKEFKEDSDGTYGLEIVNSLNPGSAVYLSSGQHVAVARNQEEGVTMAASSPHALKVVVSEKVRLTEAFHLREGELMHVKTTSDGKDTKYISWFRDANGKWVQTPKERMEAHFYPTSKMVDGVPNPYYEEPPIEYEFQGRRAEADLNMTTASLYQDQLEWDNPDSFNSQSAMHLAQRLMASRSKRLVIIGYGVSKDLPEDIISTLKKMVDGLVIDIVDANAFMADATQFHLTPDTVVLVCSKSGATFATTASLKVANALVGSVDPKRFEDFDNGRYILQYLLEHGLAFRVADNAEREIRLVFEPDGSAQRPDILKDIKYDELWDELSGNQNLFVMTARKDSMLVSDIGQGLRPQDRFSKRVFFTGQFYPSEAPGLGATRLRYHLTRLALALALNLQGTPQNHPYAVNFSPDKIQKFLQDFREETIKFSKQLTGVDEAGRPYKGPVTESIRKIRQTGRYMGSVMLEGILTKTWVFAAVFFILRFHLTLGTFVEHNAPGLFNVPMVETLLAFADATWILFLLPWAFKEFVLRKLSGRPANGRMGQPNLLVLTSNNPPLGKIARESWSRLFNTGLASNSPNAKYNSDPTGPAVTDYSRDMGRGDIILNLITKHHEPKTRMSIAQMMFQQTGALFGLNYFKGGPQKVKVEVVTLEGDTPQETAIYDGLIGGFKLMLADQFIGVKASMMASFGGRLFMPGSSFSGGNVDTTPTPQAYNAIARSILSRIVFKGVGPADAEDHAMGSTAAGDKGGIDMNSRLMHLDVTGDKAMPVHHDNPLMLPAVAGLTPRVSEVVFVTPVMLEKLLSN